MPTESSIAKPSFNVFVADPFAPLSGEAAAAPVHDPAAADKPSVLDVVRRLIDFDKELAATYVRRQTGACRFLRFCLHRFLPEVARCPTFPLQDLLALRPIPTWKAEFHVL